MALMPHKRKQPDPDTSSDTDTGSLAPRVLVRRKVNGGRPFNGPEGYFPGADIPYETMRKFEGASKSSKPPASEADLKIARKAVEDAWRSLDKDDAPGKDSVFSMLPAIGKGGVTKAVVMFVRLMLRTAAMFAETALPLQSCTTLAPESRTEW